MGSQPIVRRAISSALTFIYKVIFPPVWIGGFALATIFLFAGGGTGFRDTAGNPLPPQMKWYFLLGTVAGGALLYRFCVRLKRVELDDAALYVSNYAREIRVPLRDIEDVTENRWINIHPVTVHFFRETEFGTSIVFMPEVRWFAFFSSHPIVAELREAARRARGESSRGVPPT